MQCLSHDAPSSFTVNVCFAFAVTFTVNTVGQVVAAKAQKLTVTVNGGEWEHDLSLPLSYSASGKK
jgi:hypothetical protein